MPENQSKNVKETIRQNIIEKKKFLDSADNRAVKDLFLEKYIFCEIATKKIMSRYVAKTNKKISTARLQWNTIEKALLDAKYDIDQEMLKKVFKAQKKRGSHSARDLRNKIVHELSVRDMEEVIDRKDEMFMLLDSYLDLISGS